jgi:hypothetical protein
MSCGRARVGALAVSEANLLPACHLTLLEGRNHYRTENVIRVLYYLHYVRACRGTRGR